MQSSITKDNINLESFNDSNIRENSYNQNCTIKKYLIIILMISGIILGGGIACAISIPLVKNKYNKDNYKPVIYPYGTSSNTTYILGHRTPDTDSITSAIVIADLEKRLGNQNKLIPCRLGELNKETKLVLEKFNVEVPKLITSTSGATSVILTDHNEYEQSVTDLESSKITIDKVYDHHAINGFKYPYPLDINTKSYGSTCSILYVIYKNYNFEIPKDIAGLIASAIISDTILLRSNSTTELDKIILKEVSKIADINYNQFGEQMLRAYTNISDLTDLQVLNYDTKTYNDNDNCSHIIKYRIGTISTLNIDEFLSKRKTGLLNLMKEKIQSEKYEVFVYFIVDIINFNSYAFIEGNIKELIKKELKCYVCSEYQTDVYFLKGVSSRKRQIAPKIKEVINNNCFNL